MNRNPRQVGLKTILDSLKRKPIHLSVGLTITLIPLGIGTIFLFVFSLLGSDVPDVDYDQVNKNGKTTTAIVTNIRTQENITINNEHPSIVSYKYANGDKEIESRYKSLALRKIDEMNVGDTIQVKYLADSSIIIGLEPFEFPLDIILDFVIVFMVIGLVILTLLYLRVRNEINLYRNGEIKDAEIVSMTPKNGLSISGIGQGVTVHYLYKTARGQNILGESFTSDFTILNSKKQGDLIKIFVSLDNESKSCLISKLDQLRNNWVIE